MTLTLIDPAPRPIPTPARADASCDTRGSALLAVLREVVASSAGLDPDALHSTLPAGRAVLTLTAAARAHAASRGVDPGTSLTDGPGIVVMRDLVAVLGLLERTVDLHAAPTDPTACLPRELVDAHRGFLQIIERRA